MSEAQKRTPRPVPERRDAKSYPLTPVDGFVLSRIDGTLNEADLSASTGIPEDQVKAALEKLESLGLIAFGAPIASGGAKSRSGMISSPLVAAVPQPPPAPAPAPPPPQASSPAPPAPAPSGPRPAGSTLTAEEQASMGEEIDLEPDLRRRILDAHRDLEARDFYALLGVADGADRKAVKRAYYELAAAFHPDRYFRKRLGSFKVRMEAVFARLTMAHDTLSDRQKRAEYDAYLSEQRIAQAIEENLAQGLSQAKQAEERVERSVKMAPEEPPPPPPKPAAPSTPAPEVDLGARRNALARRLLGGNGVRPSASPAARSMPPAAAAKPAHMSTEDAMAALKRRYDERMQRAKSSEARRYAAQAETALASNDMVGAANAFRIAANLSKDDSELERKAREARQEADQLLRETYTRQAKYEEGQNQWPEAARSWSRVCRVSPDDARAHERAAHALVKCSGDMHDGVKFGQKACELEPGNAYYRVTLASCYSAAGLTLNARRELDTAAQLAPHDDTLQSMIKRVAPPPA